MPRGRLTIQTFRETQFGVTNEKKRKASCGSTPQNRQKTRPFVTVFMMMADVFQSKQANIFCYHYYRLLLFQFVIIHIFGFLD